MRTSPFHRTACIAVSLVSTVAGCASSSGGGPANEPPTLSALQAVYESVALAQNGGIHNVGWSMPATGMPTSCPTPPTRNCSFIIDVSSGGLTTSPLTTGMQTESYAWISLSSGLAVPALPVNVDTPAAEGDVPASGSTSRLPDMVVKGGQVLVVAEAPAVEQVSYVGDGVRIDHLATDGVTVAFSEIIASMNVVDVSGATAATLAGEIAAWLNQHRLASNAVLLKAGATFGPGAARERLHRESPEGRNGDPDQRRQQRRTVGPPLRHPRQQGVRRFAEGGAGLLSGGHGQGRTP